MSIHDESFYRVYRDPGPDGYPPEWHSLYGKTAAGVPTLGIKHYVRLYHEDRCERCQHPYAKGEGEWSACDARCTHRGPVRSHGEHIHDDPPPGGMYLWLNAGVPVEAQWRILTVHHLNGVSLLTQRLVVKGQFA